MRPLLTFLALLGVLGCANAQPFKIELAPATKQRAAAIEVNGLSPDALKKASDRIRGPSAWESFLKVQVVDPDNRSATDRPALLGNWHVAGDRLRFEPRFPLAQGTTYRVSFRPSALTDGQSANGDWVVAEVTVPAPGARPATTVAAVYPTADRLPENQLKFYVHFSAPMSRGDVYQHVELLGETGKPIVRPFLEIDEELWDRSGTRITLLIDPGRIKRGLKPREDLGPVLEQGKKYTLVIKPSWLDADGKPLKVEYRKAFSAGPADEDPPDPKTWKLVAPSGAKGPVELRFPKPMDHALLHRVVSVRGPDNTNVPGTVLVRERETVWQFTPEKPWAPGRYRVEVGTIVEDLAGNRLGVPFEVDVFRPAPKRIESDRIELPFEVRSLPDTPP